MNPQTPRTIKFITNTASTNFVTLLFTVPFRGLKLDFDIYVDRHVSSDRNDHATNGTCIFKFTTASSATITDSSKFIIHHGNEERFIEYRIQGSLLEVYLRSFNGYSTGTITIKGALGGSADNSFTDLMTSIDVRILPSAASPIITDASVLDSLTRLNVVNYSRNFIADMIYPVGSLYSVVMTNCPFLSQSQPPPVHGFWNVFGYTGYGTSLQNHTISTGLWYSFHVMFNGSQIVDMTFNVQTPENTNITIPLSNHGVRGVCHYPEAVAIQVISSGRAQRRFNVSTNWTTTQPINNTTFPVTSNSITIDTNSGSTTKIRNYFVTVKCLVDDIITLFSQLNPNSNVGITWRRTA
jgi:hypothetical protein